MLRLTLKKHDIVTITLPSGERIAVSLEGFRGKYTEIGFDWPRDSGVTIYREEVLKRMEDEKL